MSNRYLLYLIPILFLALLLTGFKVYNNQGEKVIQAANKLYQQGEYEQAGELYNRELAKDPAKKKLNYNFANVKYKTGYIQEALELYQKGSDCPEKYLLTGNISYKLAEEGMNPAEKINLYQQAIQFYREGIEKFPREINLKYNYEYVKEKLEELQKQMQSQEEQSSKEQSEDEGEEDNSELDEQGNSEEEQSNEGNKQEEDKKNKDKQDGQEENQTSNLESEIKSGEDEDMQNQEDIMQILKMLEAEEEESLKNNQSFYPGIGEEEEYDW